MGNLKPVVTVLLATVGLAGLLALSVVGWRAVDRAPPLAVDGVPQLEEGEMIRRRADDVPVIAH